MKVSVVLLIVLGLVGAVCASIMVAMLRSANRQLVPAPLPADVKVLVAARPLDWYTVVDKQAVVAKTARKDQAPPGSIGTEERVIGRLLSQPVAEGQPFTESVFFQDDDTRKITTLIRDGMRAVTVSLPRYASLGGLLYPGSVVDVLATFRVPSGDHGQREALSNVLLEGVAVIAVGDRTIVSPVQEKPDKASPTPRTDSGGTQIVGLLVESWQAKILQLAMQNGAVSLALRNPQDKTKSPGGPTSLDWLVTMTTERPRYPLAGEAGSEGSESPAGAAHPVPSAPTAAVPREPATLPALVQMATSPEKRSNQWETLILRGGRQESKMFPLAPEANSPSP